MEIAMKFLRTSKDSPMMMGLFSSYQSSFHYAEIQYSGFLKIHL